MKNHGSHTAFSHLLKPGRIPKPFFVFEDTGIFEAYTGQLFHEIFLNLGLLDTFVYMALINPVSQCSFS
jgi:hypothetical protein